MLVRVCVCVCARALSLSLMCERALSVMCVTRIAGTWYEVCYESMHASIWTH